MKVTDLIFFVFSKRYSDEKGSIFNAVAFGFSIPVIFATYLATHFVCGILNKEEKNVPFILELELFISVLILVLIFFYYKRGGKATAIEQYFLSDIFVYDDEFAPVDSSPETFLFNYRRGVCSDYATAMVLLCRELGLKSRYVEGFLVQKYNSENEYYYVTAADSHAYVQVWIDGYGWTGSYPCNHRHCGFKYI